MFSSLVSLSKTRIHIQTKLCDCSSDHFKFQKIILISLFEWMSTEIDAWIVAHSDTLVMSTLISRVKMTLISFNIQDGRRGPEADALWAFSTNIIFSASAPVLVMCIVSAWFKPLKQISWYLCDHFLLQETHIKNGL